MVIFCCRPVPCRLAFTFRCRWHLCQKLTSTCALRGGSGIPSSGTGRGSMLCRPWRVRLEDLDVHASARPGRLKTSSCGSGWWCCADERVITPQRLDRPATGCHVQEGSTLHFGRPYPVNGAPTATTSSGLTPCRSLPRPSADQVLDSGIRVAPPTATSSIAPVKLGVGQGLLQGSPAALTRFFRSC